MMRRAGTGAAGEVLRAERSFLFAVPQREHHGPRGPGALRGRLCEGRRHGEHRRGARGIVVRAVVDAAGLVDPVVIEVRADHHHLVSSLAALDQAEDVGHDDGAGDYPGFQRDREALPLLERVPDRAGGGLRDGRDRERRRAHRREEAIGRRADRRVVRPDSPDIHAPGHHDEPDGAVLSRVESLAADGRRFVDVLTRHRHPPHRIGHIFEHQDDRAPRVDPRVVIVLELGGRNAVAGKYGRARDRLIAGRGQGIELRPGREVRERRTGAADGQTCVRSKLRLIHLDLLKVLGGRGWHVRASKRVRDVLFRPMIAGVTETAAGQLVAGEHGDVLLELGCRHLLNGPFHRDRKRPLAYGSLGRPRGGAAPTVSRPRSATVINRGNISVSSVAQGGLGLP